MLIVWNNQHYFRFPPEINKLVDKVITINDGYMRSEDLFCEIYVKKYFHWLDGKEYDHVKLLYMNFNGVDHYNPIIKFIEQNLTEEEVISMNDEIILEIIGS